MPDFFYFLYCHSACKGVIIMLTRQVYLQMQIYIGEDAILLDDKARLLKTEVMRLKKERNAVIMAHYYQTAEIQEIADFVGDSLELARKAADTDAEVIVLCGVHFMAESAAILSPEKIVLLPDETAG